MSRRKLLLPITEAASAPRPRRPRGKTIRMKRLTPGERMETEAILLDLGDFRKPQTRSECASGQRPCPFVSCKYHLFLDVNPETGTIKINRPGVEVWEMKETCALDIADQGGTTLEEVGAIVNLTRERIRQLEVLSLGKLKTNLNGHAEEIRSLLPDAAGWEPPMQPQTKPRPDTLRALRAGIEKALASLRAWPERLAYDAGVIEVKAEAAILALSARDVERCRARIDEAAKIELMQGPYKPKQARPFEEALAVIDLALGGAVLTPPAPSLELVPAPKEPLLPASALHKEGQDPKKASYRVVHNHKGPGRRSAPRLPKDLAEHLGSLVIRFGVKRVSAALGLSYSHLITRRHEGRLMEEHQVLLRAIPVEGLPGWKKMAPPPKEQEELPVPTPKNARDAFWSAIKEGAPGAVLVAAKQAVRAGIGADLRKILEQQLKRLTADTDTAPSLLRVRHQALEVLK